MNNWRPSISNADKSAKPLSIILEVFEILREQKQAAAAATAALHALECDPART